MGVLVEAGPLEIQDWGGVAPSALEGELAPKLLKRERGDSSKAPGRFKESSKKVQGKFKESSRKAQGKFKESSRTVQGKFRESSRFCPI